MARVEQAMKTCKFRAIRQRARPRIQQDVTGLSVFKKDDVFLAVFHRQLHARIAERLTGVVDRAACVTSAEELLSRLGLPLEHSDDAKIFLAFHFSQTENTAGLGGFDDDAEHAESLEELLGIEGNGARVYFQNFAGMIKPDNPFGESDVNFDFKNRNRRPPRDPVNALLSLANSVLAKDLTIVCHAVDFDPFLGFYHQPRFGRAALALDLMEPFRPLIADSAVLNAINTRMATASDFVQAGNSVSLTQSGRKAFFRAFEQCMDSLVTHPAFGYRINYRRVLEIQARLLARVLTGELGTYPAYTTR